MSDFDRFVEFLRREATSYHEPPATPREDMWVALEAGLRDDGFIDFLRREGATYHEPPVTPRDEIWASVQAGLRDERAALNGDEPVDPAALAYNEPTSTPRDEMWPRIEAAWRMRAALEPEAREAGLDDLAGAPPVAKPAARSGERRSVGLWIAGLAVAASLVLGVVIGRGTVPFGSSGPRVATVDSAAGSDTGAPQGSTVPATERGSLAAAPDRTLDPGHAGDPGEERSLETRPRLVSADPAGSDATESAPDGVDGGERRDAALDAERRNRVVRYATARYLGRAETLLTAFRAGADDDAGLADLASWARDLLGETRLLLDAPVERTPEEEAILRELELLLAQIGQLGPDAPDFERDLVEEGIERQGTLPRLRAAVPRTVSG